MILLCQNCGWRINERRDCKNNPEQIGKYLLYNHKPFCSELCIENTKAKPYDITRPIIPSDWNELGDSNPSRPNGIENWKTERKINRSRPMRKLFKLYKVKKND